MAAHPKVFSRARGGMVRAGLEEPFLRSHCSMSRLLQKQDQLRAKVVGAMTYPIVVMVVGFLVTIILVSYIVPMFEPFFKGLNGAVLVYLL